MNFHVVVDILFCIGFGPFTFELDGYSYLARIHFSNFRFHFSSLLNRDGLISEIITRCSRNPKSHLSKFPTQCPY